MILSVSRRTDIPAYFGEWFMNRLRSGEVMVRNPFNTRQVSCIPLSPGTVDCIVFWTKDPGPMLPNLDEIDSLGYKYYFLYTLNPYGRGVEQNIAPIGERIETFRKLAARLGPERVIWRYDPVLLTPEMDADYHYSKFEALSSALEGCTRKCIFSFIEEYGKIMPRMREIGLISPGDALTKEIAGGLSEIAGRYAIRLASCAGSLDLKNLGIEKSRCVDPDLVERLSGRPGGARKDGSQRASCGCAVSRDIGTYNSCAGGCIYCYANVNRLSAKRRAADCDPHSPLLCDSLRGNEKVSGRRPASG